ncbi:metallophosphoesterase [Acidothermus cellulolyticus 11B]|uniref:Nuclease SbcCD subunit D n=2 Tax=Acidothermus cellulolyticus TaxID=28049 RepID=A0LT33_ACIC1|nr:metallophosphoesterase [Acidothermus cellulolyticus 11B]
MNRITFLHTADWQLGKPFAQVADPDKRSAIRKARIDVLDRISEIAAREGAAFVVVAGDLFDSTTVDKPTVSAACAAIGRFPVPVLVIPGNHDHGGPGSIWQQPFFQRECAQLAPNLTVLLEPAPVLLEQAVILPCPLLHRAVSGDPSAWLHDSTTFDALPPDLPRIVVAHGSTQRFVGGWADDDEEDPVTNFIDLDRLERMPIDYVALGDWHGTLQVGVRSWYAGTPEPDRFPKGDDQDPGNVLVVRVAREELPEVQPIRTARLSWRRMTCAFTDDASLDTVADDIGRTVGDRAGETLLRLALSGSLGIEAHTRLEQLLDSWQARLAWLKISGDVRVAPTDAEIAELARRPADPLIAGVAAALIARATRAALPDVAHDALATEVPAAEPAAPPAPDATPPASPDDDSAIPAAEAVTPPTSPDDDAHVAQLALRLLYEACRQEATI